MYNENRHVVVFRNVRNGATVVTLLFSEDTFSSVNMSAFVEAHTQYDISLKSGGSYTLAGDFLSGINRNFGEIELYSGSDAQHKAWQSMRWSGASVSVYVCPRTINMPSFPSQFTLIFSSEVSSCSTFINNISDTAVTSIGIADKYTRLNSPISNELFAGNGSLIGGFPTLLGSAKPCVYGKVYNIKPVCVDASNQVYCISNAIDTFNTATIWDDITNFDTTTFTNNTYIPIDVNIINAYDNGVALLYDGSTTSLSILWAYIPLPGHYAICSSVTDGNYAKLGSSIVGDLTMDCMTATTQLQPLAQLIARETVASGLPTNSGVVGGVYCVSTDTKLEAINTMLAGSGVGIVIRDENSYELIPLFLPAGEAVATTLQKDDVLRVTYIQPKYTQNGSPAQTIAFEYRKNYTVQTGTLSDGISLERRVALGREMLASYTEANNEVLWDNITNFDATIFGNTAPSYATESVVAKINATDLGEIITWLSDIYLSDNLQILNIDVIGYYSQAYIGKNVSFDSVVYRVIGMSYLSGNRYTTLILLGG